MCPGERRTLFSAAFCLLVCFTARVEAGSASRLPDGTEFPFWEKALSFTRTYYVDGGSPRSDDRGPGTIERPFRTIGKAAEVLQPGERVVIAAGTYRECIRPARGGSAPDRMISYEAAPGAVVVVKASEVLRDGWQPSTETIPGAAEGAVRIWKHELSGALFPDAYNPFGIANVPGDWAWLDTKRVDMGPYFRRRGMVFVDGRPLEPVEQYRELGDVPLPGTPVGPEPPRNGLPARTRGGPILQEVGGSPEARFWVEHQGNVVHVRVPSGDPARSVVEITTREQAFAPRQSGLGYIRIKGLTFLQGGNGFPPPQRGLVSTAGGHHWIIEGNTIEWAGGMGLDIGAQHWRAARDPLAGDSHVVRGNTIRHVGVEGIGGMGTTNTLIEDNLIEWVGWQDAERAWEAAGAKFHRARNLLFRRNVIRHMRHANALWLDSGNANSRVTANVFADVLTVSAAIHMEMNREPNQIDDNIVWDVRNAEPGTPGQRGAGGSGIFLHASERQIVAQNLVGRCDNAGVFPALRPERVNAGAGRGHQVHNNVFARCDKGGIVFAHEDNAADGNVYAGLPQRFGGLGEADSLQWLDLAAWRAHGWDRQGSTAELEVSFDPDRLELTIAGPPEWPAVPIFNGIDTDLAGRGTNTRRPPGPLLDPGAARGRSVDPRTAPAPTPAPIVTAVVDAGKTAAPINPNLYGMFIEHAGNLVYRGLWAELIDDRKFFNPVTNDATEAAPVRRGPFGGPPRRWTPVGPIESISMDALHAYAGDHSPAIALASGEARGVRQKGLTLLRGKSYTGRIVLAGDPAARTSISLIWGAGPGDRQTVTIETLTPAYATFPLAFESAVDTEDAQLEITATGPGTLRIGAVSLMPADNVHGWRPEVVAVLKSLRSGVYRWPGGNFVSAHDWRDAIGDPDRRPPIWDPVWSAVQPNDVGTDEFMTLCRLTGVEPYITVNSGFGDARSAAEYVEYANGAATTPWGAKRAANGHPEPYRVKLWNIGNEMWGSWQYGYMPLAQYVVKHNQFARAMRKADPAIVLIGSGAMPDTMTGSKESLKLGDKLIPDYLGPADWTGALFQKCLGEMDMISEHYYNYDSHFDLASAQQVPNDPNEPLVDWMRRPANHIRLKYEEYQEYLKRIPALAQKPVPIALDEYAYARATNYKVVPAYAWNFHEMFRHADLYQLATLTFVTATYSAARGQAVLSPTGMLFKLYRDHFGSSPVAVSGNAPQPKPKDPPGGEQPVVHAGSDTFPLDVAAAWTADHKALTVAVINPTESTQSLSLQIVGAKLAGKGVLRRMAPRSLTANVVVGQEPGVIVEELPLRAVPREVTLAPWSVNLYELPAK